MTSSEAAPCRRSGCRSPILIYTACGCSQACAATSRRAMRLLFAWRHAEHRTTAVLATAFRFCRFFPRRFDRNECARELGITPYKTTLLLMTGGAGLAGGDLMLERLLPLRGDF